MTYPTIPLRRSDELVAALLAVKESDRTDFGIAESEFVIEKVGGDYPRNQVEVAAAADRADWEKRVKESGGTSTLAQLYRLEARMAASMHAALQDVDVAVLADIDFWRYAALFPYRWYLVAREPELQPQDYGGTSPDDEYPDKRHTKDPKYQLLLRTFLWGKTAHDPSDSSQPYARATKVGDVEDGGAEIDVWHSHMIRTQLGHLGAIPHHFIDSICEKPTTCDRDGGRDVEKRLTRMKHNVLLDVYGADGRALVDEQKQAVLAAKALKPKKA